MDTPESRTDFVKGVEIARREVVLNGQSFGSVGPYEKNRRDDTLRGGSRSMRSIAPSPTSGSRRRTPPAASNSPATSTS